MTRLYFRETGGGGGGSTTFNQYTIAFDKLGPASYATGGFVIDLSATYSSLNDFSVEIVKGTRGNVPFGRFEYALNTPTAGKVTVKIQKYQQERVSSYDTITGQPGGVTVQTVSGQTSSSELAHTHNANHDHGNFTSAGASQTGAAVLLDAVGPMNYLGHTHTLDLASIAVTSGVGTSHNHIDNTLYQHQHTLTHVATNVSVVELPNATVLSATTFSCLASGVRA